jgi:hypothetical protein
MWFKLLKKEVSESSKTDKTAREVNPGGMVLKSEIGMVTLNDCPSPKARRDFSPLGIAKPAGTTEDPQDKVSSWSRLSSSDISIFDSLVEGSIGKREKQPCKAVSIARETIPGRVFFTAAFH